MTQQKELKQGKIYFYAFKNTDKQRHTILKLEFIKEDNGFLSFKSFKKTGEERQNGFFIPNQEQFLNNLQEGF